MELKDILPKSVFNFDDKEFGRPLRKEVKLTGDIARACLDTKEFQTYRKQYEKLEEGVIDELIREAANFCVSGDSIEKFGGKCLVKLTRLRDLRSLITKIKNDSTKGLDNVEI